MRSRPDDVRKRIANRKKERERQKITRQPPKDRDLQHRNLLLPDDDEKQGFDWSPTYEMGPGEGDQPSFRKEAFLFKLLISAVLFLVTAILFRNDASPLEPARNFVKKTMDKDFQFAAVSDWYEEKFGEPLAFFQMPDEKKDKGEVVDGDGPQYALPASGKILEDFEVSGQRIMIETEKDAIVEAMDEGMVRFVGEKEDFGKTVIIQHGDKSETWYGNLSEINVKLYDYIDKEKVVGKVTNGKTEKKGAFYFAIKKGDDFIDPIQVIQFE